MRPADPLTVLAHAAKEGDNAAVAELVRRTQPAVWQLCSALGSRGEVDDLVQDTYLRALRALPDYRGDAPVQAWLLSIARHVCADHVRRRQRQRRLIDRVAANTVSTASSPPDTIDELVRRLEPDRREAFVLTQMIGLSYDEAAEVAGCPIGTIRSRVSRARADLFTLLRQAEAI